MSENLSMTVATSMSKWMIWSNQAVAKNYNLHFIIHGIEGLSVDGIHDYKNYNLFVRIEWIGKKVGFGSRAVKRNCTSTQSINPDGTIHWDEEFEQVCKMKLQKSKGFRSWIIDLEVHGFGSDSDARALILAKVGVDIAEFVSSANISEETITIPINCEIGGSTMAVGLRVTVKLFELQSNGKTAQALIFPSLSCIGLPKQHENHHFQQPKPRSKMVDESQGTENSSVSDAQEDSSASMDVSNTSESSDDETELKYRKLAATNLLIGAIKGGPRKSSRDGMQGSFQSSPDQPSIQQQPALVRLLSWNKSKRRLSFGVVHHPRDTPLLSKERKENGGDDIDNDRRHQSNKQLLSPAEPRKPQLEKISPGFKDDDRFEVGKWEKRTFMSRDGRMELVTEIFLASIDQRSEKAAGESACTVLVAVIADWLHRNPKTMPLRCQFDELIRKGSSEWRNLCENEDHRLKFSDRHFDLDTVLEEKIRPLSVVSEMSYVGFFTIADMPGCYEFLEGAMSFDSIWEELQNNEESKDQVYIVSWNDHFFILKVERDEFYIIDTLGERLCEGCNQAYILKFDKETAIYERESSKSDSENGGSASGLSLSRKMLCEGKASCKEFIQGFLAALPLRELQDDVQRGLTGNSPLHRRLQIEFHHTNLCEENLSQHSNKSSP